MSSRESSESPSSSRYFINPTPTTTTTTTTASSSLSTISTRNFEKSTSLIDTTKLDEMSYRPSELATISRHLSENNIQPVKQNYEDLVSCPVCYDVFDSVKENKLPKILPCQHTYCVECVRNLVHCSSSERCFNCPQCKFKVENLQDANSLPTSRIVLTLLEKDSLNYQGYASCPSCRQIRSLEVCFECNLPLCVQCVNKHFEVWKNEISTECIKTEENLEFYKNRLDNINPLIARNFESVQSIKSEIEEAYNQLIQRLNTEKDVLLRSVAEIKEDNAKYVNLKKEIAGLIASFKVFRETNESYEKKSMIGKIKKCQHNFDQAQRLEKGYIDLAQNKFKLLERFNRKQPPDLDYNISGDLIISEIELEKNASPKPKNQAPSPPTAPPRVPTPPTSSTTIPKIEPIVKENSNSTNMVQYRNNLSSNENFKVLTNSNNSNKLNKWILNSQIKPQSEISIPYMPLFLCSYGNLLFCMDNTSFLSIYEKAYSAELKLRNSCKLNVPNVKAIAVNGSYLAIAYSGLKKEQLKGTFKNMNPSGVVLFRRDEHVVCSIHEKSIDLNKQDDTNNTSFRSLSGIALNDKYLFACDTELRSIYQFDIRTGSLIKTALINDGQPTSITINENYLLFNDSINSLIYVFDINTLKLFSSINLKDLDQLNGRFDLMITEMDNYLFVKHSDNQLCLFDSNLEKRAFFNEIQFKILGFTMLKDNVNHMLVIGSLNTSKQQFKLHGYVA